MIKLPSPLVCFFNVPAHGHVNPTFPLVREMLDRGWRVHYFGDAAFEGKFLELAHRPEDSFIYYCLDYRELKAFLAHDPSDVTGMMSLAMDSTLQTATAVLPLLQDLKPDCLIYDNTCIYGPDIAKLLGIPGVSNFTMFVMDKRVRKWIRKNRLGNPDAMVFKSSAIKLVKALAQTIKIYRTYRKTFGFSKRPISSFMVNRGALNLLHTSPRIQPAMDLLGPDFMAIGPSVRQQNDDISELLSHFDPNKALVFFSLGTAMNSNERLYRDFISNCAMHDLQALISTGGRIDPDSLGPVPQGIRIYSFVPQVAVLGKVDAFVTHGGMNSAHEALVAGVPTVLLPQHQEQELVARQMERLGAGIALACGETDMGMVVQALQRVLADESYRRNAQEIGASFRDLPGIHGAVNAIEALIHAHRQRLGAAETVQEQ